MTGRRSTVFLQAVVVPVGIGALAFVAGGEVIIMLTPSDDRAGGIAIGILIALVAAVMAAPAAMSGRIVQAARRENP